MRRWGFDGTLLNLDDVIGPIAADLDPTVRELALMENGRTGGPGYYRMPIGLTSLSHPCVAESAGPGRHPARRDSGEWDAFWDFWCDTVQPPVGEVRLRTEAGEQVLPVEQENLYVRAVRRFHGAVRGMDTPAATGEDGVRSLALGLAVREAAHSGRRVQVDPASTA